MSPRVTYWLHTWDPRQEGISKEVAALRVGSRLHAPVVAFSPRLRTRYYPAERVLTLSARRWMTLRGLAAALEPRADVTHVFGGHSSWHLLRALGRRPLILTAVEARDRSQPLPQEDISTLVVEADDAVEDWIATGVPREKIRVIPPGVDLDEFDVGPLPPSRDGRLALLFASTPSDADEMEARGIPLLVELARKRPDIDIIVPWRPWGDQRKAEKAVAALRPPANFIVQLGTVAEMRALFARVHATVAAFRPDAGKLWPNFIIEGLAAGRPCLTVRGPAFTKTIERAGAGILTDRTVEALAASVDDLRRDLPGLADRAHDLATRRFDVRLFRLEYDQLYETLHRPVERVVPVAPRPVASSAMAAARRRATPLKILFPVHGILGGVGSEDYMLEVARGLAARGHEITLALPRGSQPPPEFADRVLYWAASPRARPVLWRFQYAIAALQQVLATAIAGRHKRFDAVMTGVLPALRGFALSMRQTPTFYLAQSPLAWYEILSYEAWSLKVWLGAVVYHRLQRWAWSRTDAVVSYLPQLTAMRADWYRCGPRRLVESPPGVDLTRFTPSTSGRDPALLAELGIPPDAPLVVAFSRLIRSKDLAFLLRAFGGEAMPAETHLLILGRGPEQPALEALAGELDLGARVHFAGFRENVEEYLRLGHVYAFPSRLESFGLTLAQAMASGLPTVARRSRLPTVVTVTESIVADGRTGVLVDTEVEMAQAIAALLRRPDRRAAMGQAAAAHARAEFDWTRHLDGIETVLLEITEPAAEEAVQRQHSRLVARNVLSNWLSLGSNVASTLLLTPIVVGSLKTELYGVWSFLNGLVNYSDLLYLGLGSALIRYVAEAHATNDAARVNRLTSVVISIYAVIGCACMVLLTAVSGLLPHVFKEGLSAEAARSASWTCVLLGVRLWLIFIASGFSGLLSGHERFDLVNVVSIVGLVVRFVGTLVFVPTSTHPLLTLAIIVAGSAALETLALAAMSYAYRPDLAIRLVRPTRDELTQLYRFGIQSFLVLLAFKLISYTDMTVIGVMLGAPAVALYVLPLQLVEYLRMCVGGFANVFLPRVTALVAKNDTPALRRAYEGSTRIAGFLAGWLGGLVIMLGPPFLSRWVGPTFAGPAQPVLIWLSISAFAYAISTQSPFPYWQALRVLGRPAIILTVEAFINLGLSLWLALKLGITGVALATAIPAVGVSLVWLPRYLCTKLDLPWSRFLVGCVGPGLLTGLVVTLGEWGLGHLLPGNSYLWLAVRALASLPVGLGLFALTFPSDEWRAFLDLLPRTRFTSSQTLSS